MKWNWKPLLAGALLALGWQAGMAQSLILDTAGVEAAIKRGAVLWDARDADDFAAGHIPGAVNFGYAGDLFRHRPPRRSSLSFFRPRFCRTPRGCNLCLWWVFQSPFCPRF